MGLFRKKQVNEEIPLSSGIVMREPLTMQTSSWLKNCMAKSVLVFSIIFGTIGCFLSSYKIEYNVLSVAVVLFLMALLFTSIYYRGWLMDVVYIIFFAFFVLLIRMFRMYVNSGFYVIVNAFLETIQDYFNLPGMQFYEVEAENERLAVTISVIFIGTVMMIVANVILSRTMNAWFLLIMTGWLFVVPLFFRLEPDAFYVVLLMTGYISVWAIHSSGAYGMDVKHRDYKWKDRKGKELRFWYMQDATTMLESIAMFLILIIIVYGITTMVQNKNTFNARYNQNPLKIEDERNIQNLATRGANWMNGYDATGGVNEGRLGGINSVNSDYQTDLIVTFAPYTYQPIYLKGYTGIYYDSVASRWFDTPYNPERDSMIYIDNLYGYDSVIGGDNALFFSDYRAEEAERLAYNYQESEGEQSARAIMLVQNLGANRNYAFAPYYIFSQTLYPEKLLSNQRSTVYEPKYIHKGEDAYEESDVAEWIQSEGTIIDVHESGRITYQLPDAYDDRSLYVVLDENGKLVNMNERVLEQMNQTILPYVELGETLTGSTLHKRVLWGDQTTSVQYYDILSTDEFGNGAYAEYEYYPLVSDTENLKGSVSEEMKVRAEVLCTSVPAECEEAVRNACLEAGITEYDSDEEIISKVTSYLENEFSYTLRPRRTPDGEDFITHFLEEKRGFCVHFASAGTMMLRYCGIPARYTEGYVITFDDMIGGELNEDYSYEEFYQGYNPLGETAVIDVEISDARGHAWVEYFDDRLGWRQLEVTTAAVEPEEEEDSFWDAFGGGGTGEGTGGEFDFGNGLNIPTVDLNLDDLRGIWLVFILVLAVIFLILLGKRIYIHIREYRTWHTDDLQENVLAYYHIISKRLRRKESGYAICPTYQDQLHYMRDHCKEWNWDADQIALLLERAGYSRQGIEEFDCKRLMIELADIEKKVKQWKKYRI